MSGIPPAQLASDLVNRISRSLAEGQLQEAFEIINDNKYGKCLKNDCWDLIPVIVQYLDKKTWIGSIELFKCCEKLLRLLAEKSNPEEALLEFIEQAEIAKDDTKFISVIRAIKTILMKLTNKRNNSLEWTHNTIQAHLSELPLPGEHNLEEDEKILLDADDAVHRISILYTELIPFYEPFIKEISVPKPDNQERRKMMASFLLQLLGKPLACLDLEKSKTKSQPRLCTEKLMLHLSELVSDSFKFLEYVSERSENASNNNNNKNNTNKDLLDDEPIQDVFACHHRTPTLSLGVYFYLLLSENVDSTIPHIYDPIYVFQTTLFLAAELLRQPEQYITRKGLLLAHAIICGPLLQNKTVPHDLLDSTVHCNFCLNLINVVIYSDIKANRELGLCIFKTYLFKFDTKGRYLLISNLMNNVKHMNTRGYLISQYKDMVREILSNDENNVSEYFSGIKMFKLINTFCTLPEGPETDLMEHGDQFITSLNLLIYLAIRDKYNITGIWTHFEKLDKSFFKPLKEALKLSKAHYELKMKELEDEKGQGDSNMSVTVHGKALPCLSFEDKKMVINSALNSFSVLEMLLVRIENLVSEGPEVAV